MNSTPYLMRPRLINIQQLVTIRAGTGTSAPRLYAKPVVKQYHNQVIMRILYN